MNDGTFLRTEAIAAALARKAGRPVRLVLPRDEEWLTLNRHPATIAVRLGARSDGTLVAKQVVCHAGTGAYADCGPGVAQKILSRDADRGRVTRLVRFEAGVESGDTIAHDFWEASGSLVVAVPADHTRYLRTNCASMTLSGGIVKRVHHPRVII